MTLTPVEWIVFATAGTLAVAAIRYFLKRVFSTLDDHGKDINGIKLDYATKKELNQVKEELTGETKGLSEDISEIKKNYLTRDDYFRSQAETARKLDRIYEILIDKKGGPANG